MTLPQAALLTLGLFMLLAVVFQCLYTRHKQKKWDSLPIGDKLLIYHEKTWGKKP